MELADAIEGRLGKLSLGQKVRLLTGADFWRTYDEPAAGLRAIRTSDGPAGVRGQSWDESDPSANIPSPTALAASWDTDLVGQVGELLAAEARRKGVDVLLAPTVNLHRTPYGGRHFECYSEDPVLTARIGAAYVAGLQRHGVAATVKHIVANDSETERMTADVRVDERTLRELYLAPFEQLVTAGAWALMAAYNGVNGHTMTEHPMLADIVQDEWGFDGLTMSDWMATRSTEASAGAGLDLAMPGPQSPWGEALAAAVRGGRVAEATIDDKVRRLLRLAARVGALDGVPAPEPPPALSDGEVAETIRAAAVAGTVLVRNAGDLLPLDRATLTRVAVLGPNAAVARTLGGGSATVFPSYTVSPLDGLRAALGDGVTVDHTAGVRASDRIAIAGDALLADPRTGTAGVDVVFLGPAGVEISHQHKRSAQAMRLGADALAGVAAVEIRGRLRAPTSGDYPIGCAGVGTFRLDVAGTTHLDGVVPLPDGADIVEAMMKPPQRIASVALEAGDEVEVVLRHEVAADAFGVMFALCGEEPITPADEELARAVSQAAEADVAVVVMGTTAEVESEGFDRDSLALPGNQDELVRRVVAANPRTVVVVNSGAPVLMPWADDVPAVLLTWFPGQECGNALADVLLGVAEPGGRLPTTWPVDERSPAPSPRPVDGVLDYAEGLHIGYRAYEKAAITPRYWFGHGLGYTTWEYAGASAGPVRADGVTVRVEVCNTGDRRGREVVQVYAARPGSGIDRPARWLAGFAAVQADPGASVAAEVVVPRRAFEHWDVATHAWTLESGDFTLLAGRSAADTPHRLVVSIDA